MVGRHITAKLIALASLAGCVRTYHPQQGLHQPVIVDITRENLRGLGVAVECLVGAGTNAAQAGTLCRQVQSLLEQQGATVATTLGGPPPDDELAPDAIDLRLTLRPRSGEEHLDTPTLIASVFTFSLAPALLELSFGLEVELRGGDGYLLSRDFLRGRFIEYYGAGAVVGNALMNLTRPRNERISSTTAGQQLSDDLYRQLSQAVFDASMHWKLARAQEAR